jgi:hypothetical protein
MAELAVNVLQACGLGQPRPNQARKCGLLDFVGLARMLQHKARDIEDFIRLT